VGQILVSLGGVLLFFEIFPEKGVVSFFLVFYVVSMINIYNFMDGIDGLAISEANTTLIFLLFFSLIKMDYTFTFLLLSLFIPLLFFYKYNWSPARMFIGDVLSGFLGFFFAMLTFYLWQKFKISFWLVPLLMMVFIFDSSLTLVKRLGRREKFWLAHNTHYYQRFAKKFGHKKVTKFIISLNFLLYGPALIIIFFPTYDFLVFAGTYIALFVFISLLEKRYLLE